MKKKWFNPLVCPLLVHLFLIRFLFFDEDFEFFFIFIFLLWVIPPLAAIYFFLLWIISNKWWSKIFLVWIMIILISMIWSFWSKSNYQWSFAPTPDHNSSSWFILSSHSEPNFGSLKEKNSMNKSINKLFALCKITVMFQLRVTLSIFFLCLTGQTRPRGRFGRTLIFWNFFFFVKSFWQILRLGVLVRLDLVGTDYTRRHPLIELIY